eukprot:1161485-Pelagomonas_calceolata.AAC.1
MGIMDRMGMEFLSELSGTSTNTQENWVNGFSFSAYKIYGTKLVNCAKPNMPRPISAGSEAEPGHPWRGPWPPPPAHFWGQGCNVLAEQHC